MKITQMPEEFIQALPILNKIKAAGFDAYFVGGSVRDVLLGNPIHDVDIATSSYPEETKAIFDKTFDVGIEHGTVLVLEGDNEYEITTFRTEDIYVDFRRPSHVTFVRSLEEDLKRRDFTINAFALDETGQVIDLFGGLEDLDKGILRAVGQASERFNEDALRIMRGLRFSATLDFFIEDATFDAMRAHAPLLEKISIERIFIEFDKLLMAKHWQSGVEKLIDIKAFDYMPLFHGKHDALKQFARLGANGYQFNTSEQAWAYLLMTLDVDVKAFSKQWKTSRDFSKQVMAIIDAYQLSEWDLASIYQYGQTTAELADDLKIAQGVVLDDSAPARISKKLQIHDKSEIVVNGAMLIQELGMKPGPQMGAILKDVEAAIVCGKLVNSKADIVAYIQENWSQS